METSTAANATQGGHFPEPISTSPPCNVTTTAAIGSPSSQNHKDRILRKGDLARILGRKDKKLRDNHQGDLARVIRSIPVGECDKIVDDKDLDYDPHPFVYDMELILGGKLTAVRRSELQYTTAFEEGMTGESRQRRKRKPKEDVGVGNTLPPLNKKKAGTKKTTTKAGENGGASKKRSASGAGGNKSKSKKQKGSQATNASDLCYMSTTTASNGMDIFERHRREFERSIVRLEKADVYQFFSDPHIPPEFDEGYASNNTQNETIESCEYNQDHNQSPNSNTPSTSGAAQQAATQDGNDSAKSFDDKQRNSFPDGPPFNLVVLRRRMEQGRYTLDLERYETEERVKLMSPYYQSIRRKIPSTRKKLPHFPVLHKKGINWGLFRKDVLGMCDAAVQRNPDMVGDGCAGTLKSAAQKLKELTEQIYDKMASKQAMDLEIANDRHRFNAAIQITPNNEAAIQGKKWRREAFPERRYEKLRNDVVCAGLSELDERIAIYELKTKLPDSFVGLAYTYDDTGQSEGWMKTMVNETDNTNRQQKAAMAALATDDGVIKAQVAATMQTLLMAVQDNVMTSNRVLEQQELRSANWEAESRNQNAYNSSSPDNQTSVAEIVEQPVWGMDCYTRRNVAICLETEFDSDTVHCFIEKWLLPAVNACPVDMAYNLSNAALILEGLPFDTSTSLNQETGTTMEEWKSTLLGKALVKKLHASSPPWLRAAAHILRRAITSLGYDFFRVHPKGHGSIVLCPKIPPNRLVTFYRGEVYPSWRWGEKMDAISLIQEKKGLKPRLPDFYNMTLERPQKDPRGYGLLFVDASRKSGYGSMLSHSCNPSCEVKVVAINGELTLAMTTLREMTVGEEVTFDYNAATDSLHEYQAAICLCGNIQCRGSFLHFATADCYQQVLNRNAPIAVRLSQLIKGCTKQVMAQEDSKILERHGFLTAAFGAVSVNRQKVTSGQFSGAELDSMEFVPIWLRTYVADTLRYIEYERRALPIALICNEITKEPKSKEDDAKNDPSTEEKASSSSKKPGNSAPKSVDDKPIKGCKPEPPFFFFFRRRREHFLSNFLKTSDDNSMTGLALERELKKLASADWKSYTQEVKNHWKEQAHEEWKKNGGEEKARLEAQRIKRLNKAKNGTALATASKHTVEKISAVNESADGAGLETDQISFQAADAEGMSAMEQRIQQLTHSLSRVGRILDRHREAALRKNVGSASAVEKNDSPTALQELTHSPLVIMPDEDVIAWMWNHPDGIVQTLLRLASEEVCVSPELLSSLKLTETKYSMLSQFGTPWQGHAVCADPSLKGGKGRDILNVALLEFRSRLLEGMDTMAAEIKKKRASFRDNAKRKKQQAHRISTITSASSQSEVRSAIKFVLNEMIETVEVGSTNLNEINLKPSVDAETSDITEPWLLNYNKRFKLEKAADLLLMYTRTSTFFRIKPYEAIQSSAIEVYAREIGNLVPLSVMDKKTSGKTVSMDDEIIEETAVDSFENDGASGFSSEPGKDGFGYSGRKHNSGICDPEDIISEVSVSYQGDYVLSQLLQWYNGGFDQKPGLPDMLGCCLLPSMTGCFVIDTTKSSSSSTDKRTSYRERTRPRLVEWLKDPYKRGSPWPDDVRRAFVDKEQDRTTSDASKCWLPIGSPVLDLLVTGDDFNMMEILGYLGSDSGSLGDDNEGLLSTIDHGRPAQAVSNWVQCENESCLKWRKIPWNVDVDLISQRFVCSDNKWNPSCASCDAPEDDWDEDNDACVEADGSVKPREMDRLPVVETEVESQPEKANRCKLADFQIGARFDVLRVGKRKKWSPATVVDVDFVGQTRRVKFHFPRTQLKNDIWLNADSHSIAPLHTHSGPPETRELASSTLKSKANNKKKAKTTDDDASESSCDMVLSESGSEDVDGGNGSEDIDGGAVESYQDIGDADTDDSENANAVVHWNDTQKEEAQKSDDEDDGLDDDIDDDSEVNSLNGGNCDSNKAEQTVVPSVTDHSSPDSEINREAAVTTSKSFTIPKKRPSGKGSLPSAIPRKNLPNSLAPQSESPAKVDRGGSSIPYKSNKLSAPGEGSFGPEQYLSLKKVSTGPDQYLSLKKESPTSWRPFYSPAARNPSPRAQYQTSQYREGFRPAPFRLSEECPSGSSDRKLELRSHRDPVDDRQLTRYGTNHVGFAAQRNTRSYEHVEKKLDVYSQRLDESASYARTRDERRHSIYGKSQGAEDYHRGSLGEIRGSSDYYNDARSSRGFETAHSRPETLRRPSNEECYHNGFRGKDNYGRDISPRRGSSYDRSATGDSHGFSTDAASRYRSYDYSVDERSRAGSWRDDDYYSRAESPSMYSPKTRVALSDDCQRNAVPFRGYAVEGAKEKRPTRGYEVQSVKAVKGNATRRSDRSVERERDGKSGEAEPLSGRWDDGRHRDAYKNIRSGLDDREVERFRQKELGYESPRRRDVYNDSSLRRREHRVDDRGREEYARRSSDYSRHNERYRDDAYRGRN